MPIAPESLTPFERQSLINQYKILAHLEPENAEDYKEKQTILQRGYSIQYGEVFETWEEKSLEQCQYVYDVLDMYRVLHYSYEGLEPAEKANIKKEDIRFRGFDGNNESERLGLVEHLKKQGLWTEILGEDRGFDTHSQVTMHLYPKMLQRYEAIMKQKSIGETSLRADEIKQVLAK